MIESHVHDNLFDLVGRPTEGTRCHKNWLNIGRSIPPDVGRNVGRWLISRKIW